MATPPPQTNRRKLAILLLTIIAVTCLTTTVWLAIKYMLYPIFSYKTAYYTILIDSKKEYTAINFTIDTTHIYLWKTDFFSSSHEVFRSQESWKAIEWAASQYAFKMIGDNTTYTFSWPIHIRNITVQEKNP